MTTDVNVKNWPWSMYGGISILELGAALLSYSRWHNFLLATLHGMCGFFYIVWVAAKYGFAQ